MTYVRHILSIVACIPNVRPDGWRPEHVYVRSTSLQLFDRPDCYFHPRASSAPIIGFIIAPRCQSSQRGIPSTMSGVGENGAMNTLWTLTVAILLFSDVQVSCKNLLCVCVCVRAMILESFAFFMLIHPCYLLACKLLFVIPRLPIHSRMFLANW